MTAKRIWLIPALLPIWLLISCGSEQPAAQQQSYKDTKTMVLDVLKTEEAEKAILASAAKNQNKTIQLLSTGEGQQIQVAVKELLTTGNQGVKMLEATMTDPKFAGAFAKAAQSSLKQMEKDLLKDPEYQKNLFEAFNNPDFQKIILETMKSQKYRQQMQEIVRECLQSPLYKAELIAMFQKAVSEEMKPKNDQTLTITGGSGGGQGGGQGQGGGEKGDQEGGKEGGDKPSQGDSGGSDGGDDQGDSGQSEGGQDGEKSEQSKDKEKK